MKKFICTAFVALTSLVSCSTNSTYDSSTNNSKSSKPSYQSLYGVNEIMWDETLKQDPNKYYVYVYSPTCYYCNSLRMEVNILANCGEFPLYFVKFSSDIPVKEGAERTIGETEQENLFISGTPTLFIVKDSAIYDCYLGYSQIYNYLHLVLDID